MGRTSQRCTDCERSERRAMEQFLADNKYNDVFTVKNGRAHCTLTGHDCANVKALQDYCSSYRFKVAFASASYDFAQHEPYVVPHKKNANKMYCTLTRRTLNRVPEQLERHVRGRKFRHRRAEHDAHAEKQAVREQRRQDKREAARLAGVERKRKRAAADDDDMVVKSVRRGASNDDSEED